MRGVAQFNLPFCYVAANATRHTARLTNCNADTNYALRHATLCTFAMRAVKQPSGGGV